MYEYKSIGFIGLGMMGVPMVENLLRKTPNATKFYIFDVVDEAVKELCSRYAERAEQAENAKDVADKAVSTRLVDPDTHSLRPNHFLGCNILHGARRFTRALSLSYARDGRASSGRLRKDADRLLDHRHSYFACSPRGDLEAISNSVLLRCTGLRRRVGSGERNIDVYDWSR